MTTAILISSSSALAIVTIFAVLAILATRRASRVEQKVAKAEIALALLDLELIASKKQRKDLGGALAVARTQALYLQEDIDAIAPHVPRSHLARVRDHIDELLQLVAQTDSDSDDNSDELRTDEDPVQGPAT